MESNSIKTWQYWAVHFYFMFCPKRCFSFCFCDVHAPNYTSNWKASLNDCYTHNSNPLILGSHFNWVMSNLDRNDSLANQTSFPGKKDIIELTSAYILFDCYRIGHPLLPGHIWCRAGKRIYSHKHFHVSTIVMILCLFPDHNTVNIRFKTSSKPLTGRGYWKYTVSLKQEWPSLSWVTLLLWSLGFFKPGFKSLLDCLDDIKHWVKGLAIKHCVCLAPEKSKQQASLLNNFANCSQETAVHIVEEELMDWLSCQRSKAVAPN